MAETITLYIPDSIMSHARDVARQSKRTLEDVLVEWLARASESQPQSPLGNLPFRYSEDEDEAQDIVQQMAGLTNGEGELNEAERARLEELLAAYRHELVVRVEGSQVSLMRSLPPSPGF